LTEQKGTDSRLALWALLMGNFIIGTGVLLPAGLLNDISQDLRISAATAGLLMLMGGVVVALGAPLAAAFTSRFDRRTLLTLALALYVGGHLASALIVSFEPLLIVRALTVVGAAVFTPQAAATAGLLVPAEQRASAIAFIFIGWSAASVAGIPLGSYISSLIGWRLVFAGMGVVSAIAALLLWKSLRPGLFVQPLNAAAWKEALSHPVILAVLAVTLISMSGQMTVFTYIAPILRDGFSGGPEEVSLAFAVAGIAGVCGNWLASRLVARLGIDQAIAMAILSLIIGIGLFAASFGVLLYALIGIGLWGLGSFSSNSLQQSRLVAIAPGLAAATVALNTSVVYVGQAVGAGLGSWFMQGAVAPSIIWTACALTALSLLMSFTATWLRKRV
jgi:predicted MFS family arabinose efflux permease